MPQHRLYTTSFASVYALYVKKVERKGHSLEQVDQIILWLTGYSPDAFAAHLAAGTDFETFFASAPSLNPARIKVTGLICGVRIETLEDPLMREIRILDKLIDELAKGRPMQKILRH
jgi:hypothetical protein